MISSYLKTSARNLLRNRLFSFINVLGLAISMSAGLLLIAFLLDLHSYDRFHENGDRIYRITNVVGVKGSADRKYASTSTKTGRLIRENATGIEEVTVLRNDFSKEATLGERVLPVKGLWAEPSLFRMFTFPMLEGDPNTALVAPYSIVLTETTAKKLFGSTPALGKAIQFDSIDYQVTGIMKDIPFFSHFRFEALVSLSSLGQSTGDRSESWATAWPNRVYVMLPKKTAGAEKKAGLGIIQSQLDEIATRENRSGENIRIGLELLPLHDIVVGETLQASEGGPGSTGPHFSPLLLRILGGLAIIVILSACFNYANLSLARATRRHKEIGLRKAVGAAKNQIWQQFVTEAVLISLTALILSCALFFILRPQLINLAPEMQRAVKLQLTLPVFSMFFLFSVAVGLIAGFIPALFFSKVNPVKAFRTTSFVPSRRQTGLRKTLVLVQYSVTLIFITSTAVGYVQYKNILAFDLGFNTENILNIDMQGNRPDVFIKELEEIPEVTAVSRSMIVTSVGNAWGGHARYSDPRDSALVMTNYVDQNYLPLHDYHLIAGGNFVARPASLRAIHELIVNQQFLKRFNVGTADQAIGKEITFSNFQMKDQKMTIVGVINDFHYGKVDNLVGPVALMPWTPESGAIVNVKIQSKDIPSTLVRLESAWKAVNRTHPFQAQFYSEAIAEAYREYSTMIRIIGFLSLLAVSIASMGLFGMVVFTTETRLKEIGIRKVMGAGSAGLVFLLSKGLGFLLCISILIALPTTYFFFENFLLKRFPYHTSVGIFELVAGPLVVLLIAFLMIGLQTIKAAETNPVKVLKSE